jgi:hypothetical protein
MHTKITGDRRWKIDGGTVGPDGTAKADDRHQCEPRENRTALEHFLLSSLAMSIFHTLISGLHGAPGSVARLWKTSVIAALCLVSPIPRAGATTYYISSSQGNDTNSGTAANTPWKSLTNVYYHTFGARIFNSGDSILLRAGDHFDGPLIINQGGTKGSPITIDRYGTGSNPIIYGDHPSAIWTAVPGQPGIYSSFLGVAGYISADRVYDINGNPYYHLLRGTNTLNTWLTTFTNSCWGADAAVSVYIKTPDSNPPPQMHIFEFTTVGAGTYFTIQNLEVCNGGKGIYVSGPGNKVGHNVIHDVYASGIYAGGASLTEIVSNTITGTGHTMIYLVGGGGNWVHYNTLSTNGTVILGKVKLPSSDLSGVGLCQGTNNLIEYNSISYMTSAFFDYYYEVNTEVRYNYGFHANFGASPSGTGLKFHHNILNLDHGGPGISASHCYDPTASPQPDTGLNLIYNNVIYGFVGYGFYTAGPSASGLVFRNNTLVMNSLSPGGALAALSAGVDSDYNLYYATANDFPSRWKWNGANTMYSTLPAFTAASGQESHGLNLNPQFVSANPTNAAGFQLKSNSPGIDAGQNLKLAGLLAPAAPYQDYLGTLIPQGTAPDIGPFEVIPLLHPPTKLQGAP